MGQKWELRVETQIWDKDKKATGWDETDENQKYQLRAQKDRNNGN